MLSLCKKCSVTVVLLVVFLAIAANGQVAADVWREAWGEPRASMVESLCGVLFPNSQLKWGQHLTLQNSDGSVDALSLPQYSQRKLGAGWEGVTGLEIGSGKKVLIGKAEAFEGAVPEKFVTEIVVFKAASDFAISSYKRVEFDPREAIKQITEMYIKDWPEGRWPILSATYHSFYFDTNSFGSVIWNAQLDANTGVLTGKFPIAIMKKHKDGSSQEDYLSIKRIDASQIKITGGMSGKTLTYPCAPTCVIDGQSLFESW